MGLGVDEAAEKDRVTEATEKDESVQEMSSSLSSTGFETDEVRNVGSGCRVLL